MRIGDRGEYLAFRTLVGAMKVAPESGVLWLLSRVADGLTAGGWFRADLARDQIAAAYPGWDAGRVEDTVRRLYRHLACTVVEVFRTPDERLRERVDVPGGWGVLDEAVAKGRGLILISGHIGNFELCGRVIAARHELLDVVKPQRNRRFDRYLDRLRRRHGIGTVPMDRAAPSVLGHLRRGKVVSLLIDQDAGDAGVRTEFFGQAASTWPGAARLSLQTGCPILPVCLVRDGGGRHVLEFGPLLEPAEGPATHPQVLAYTQRLTAQIEVFVRSHPDQWFWVHRRWKGAASAGPDQEKQP